jgi:hypothetical protein
MDTRYPEGVVAFGAPDDSPCVAERLALRLNPGALAPFIFAAKLSAKLSAKLFSESGPEDGFAFGLSFRIKSINSWFFCPAAGIPSAGMVFLRPVLLSVYVILPLVLSSLFLFTITEPFLQ